MNVLELMRKRCSIRQYSDQRIEQEKIDYLLEAGRIAPSACNLQPWFFIVAGDNDARNKVIECYKREWVKTAPLFIIICGDHSKSWKRPADGKDHVDIDAGIVTAQICLAAVEKELGSCIICHFDVPLLKKHFNLPEHVEPLVIISTGYPASPELFVQTPKSRKDLNDILI